jgi:hypothetical protein
MKIVSMIYLFQSQIPYLKTARTKDSQSRSHFNDNSNDVALAITHKK